MEDPVLYQWANHSDLAGVARVFNESFPESVRHLFGRIPPLQVTREAFRVCLAAEPEAFVVARRKRKVVGYIFAPAHLSRLWKVALGRRFIWRWLWRWITGRLRLGWHPVRLLVGNKVHFLRSAVDPQLAVEARILSVAVLPSARGQGIAKELTRRALQRFDGLGVPRVRLEVRPDNAPARRIYEQLGFLAAGTTADTQGPWLIMIRNRPA